MKSKLNNIIPGSVSVFFVLVIFALVSFASCKKSKETIGSNSKTQKGKVEEKIANSLYCQTFQSKVSVNFNDGKKDMSVTAQIKIITNNKIQISVQPLLGIELFKIEISNDSVKVLDKINKRYIAESYSEYRKYIPFDLGVSTLEALFLNRLFVPGEDVFEIRDFNEFKWRLSNNGDLTGEFKNTKYFNLMFNLNNSSFLDKTTVAVSGGKHKLNWTYSQFQELEGIDFPRVVKADYIGDKKNISLQIKYQKPEINRKINDSFEIPRSYQRVNASQILNMLLK